MNPRLSVTNWTFYPIFFNVDGYIKRLRESKAEKKDYAQYFASLSLTYHLWVRDRYLINPNDPIIIDDIYCSGISGIISQQLGGLPLPQWKKSFELALFELTALDCTEMEYFHTRSTKSRNSKAQTVKV